MGGKFGGIIIAASVAALVFALAVCSRHADFFDASRNADAVGSKQMSVTVVTTSDYAPQATAPEAVSQNAAVSFEQAEILLSIQAPTPPSKKAIAPVPTPFSVV